MFNLAANTHQLHYWRLTNQLRNNWDLAKEVFEQMNVEYTAVMRRFSSQVRNFSYPLMSHQKIPKKLKKGSEI